MNRNYTSTDIAFRLWFHTAVVFSFGLFISLISSIGAVAVPAAAIAGFIALIAGMPFLMLFLSILPQIKKRNFSLKGKLLLLLAATALLTLPYGFFATLLMHGNLSYLNITGSENFIINILSFAAALFILISFSFLINIRPVYYYLCMQNEHVFTLKDVLSQFFQTTTSKYKTMDTYHQPASSNAQSNRILIKGIITGALILLMLVPTFFISNLVTEREARQKEVVKEVSAKWASAQTLSAPFLVVPYNDTFVNSEGKTLPSKTQVILLANELKVKGIIVPEERPRSIYKVLLYRSEIGMSGAFKVAVPADINAANLDYANARLCFTLTDFKGIEEEIYVSFNGQKLLLSPGLPVNDLGSVGLSVPVNISAEAAAAGIPFSMQVKIKGSEQLHFMPVSGSSKFELASTWPSPSFDGGMLPGVRQVKDSGFSASWSFNRANLPFGTVIESGVIKETNDFGVSLVQPADQYNKTMRSVKYAILFIGLTFAFFFIIELMQKKPFHPVQYALVGLALVIFYSLLLSISEYILFDYAYLIAALATVLLISLYAKEHFKSWKTAAIFFALLSCLYGFIFILIRLEDSALLVGSIGLFIVLALVMFASRKINWYGNIAATTNPVSDENKF